MRGSHEFSLHYFLSRIAGNSYIHRSDVTRKTRLDCKLSPLDLSSPPSQYFHFTISIRLRWNGCKGGKGTRRINDQTLGFKLLFHQCEALSMPQG